jgi:hypothetical protein
MTDFRAKFESLGAKMPSWCVRPSRELVTAYERQFGLSLPTDYSEFLSELGGCVLNATAPFQEPTPFGSEVLVEQFFGFMPQDRVALDVRWNTELIDGAPRVVAIAKVAMGDMLWLKCTGADAGYVYCHPAQQRRLWSDEKFRDRFPALSSDIEHYLLLRRERRLPAKKKGYEDVYQVAASFTEFVDALQCATRP